MSTTTIRSIGYPNTAHPCPGWRERKTPCGAKPTIAWTITSATGLRYHSTSVSFHYYCKRCSNAQRRLLAREYGDHLT